MAQAAEDPDARGEAWALPFGSTSSYTLPLRPIQRDGGQPLANDAELYDLTRPSSYGDLERQWPHVFQ